MAGSYGDVTVVQACACQTQVDDIFTSFEQSSVEGSCGFLLPIKS
jgi:hypothetical protein